MFETTVLPKPSRMERPSWCEPSEPETARLFSTRLEVSIESSVYTRFFTFKKSLTDADLRQLTEVDHEHVVALLATTISNDFETLLGGGRYCSERPLQASRAAELAFMTADRHHGRGVASLILKHLVLIGREQGLSRLEADVLAQNRAMLAVLERSGLPLEQQQESNIVHVRLCLT